MRTHTLHCLKVNWNIQWFHIPKEIQISVIHSSSNTHSPVILTVSPSLLLTHSYSLISSLSQNLQFWQSHQLLPPKVIAHILCALSVLHSVMESEIKSYSNFVSQIPQKTYLLRNQIKVTSKYPNEFVRLSLTSSLSSSLRSLRSWREVVYTPLKERKM